ncbi:hypothetical protein [Paenibacillus sp. IITD108]|uniref:hypothetical protein n=1 Tax=Paenibacillus sp. IITD108 TaxID=3116649 RepID=UPI002F3EA2DA
MNLSDMLVYADIQQLNRIADMYKCDCSSNSKHDLIQSILAAMSSKAFDEHVHKMTLEELRFVNTLLFETKKAYSMEDLIARAQQSRFEQESDRLHAVNGVQVALQSANAAGSADSAVKQSKGVKRKAEQKLKSVQETVKSPREMIATFKHRGWLFNGYSGPNKYLFHVPQDMKQRFQKIMLHSFAQKLEYCNEPEAYRDEQLLFEDDITIFLRYAQQNDIQLAADGSMYKRWLTAILDRLSVGEQPPAKGEWRFGYGRHFNHYPNRFSLLYDFCRFSGYIAEQSNELLAITPAGEARLLAKNEQEISRLYQYWLKQYKLPIPNLEAIVNWLAELCGRWVTIASIEQILLPYIKPYFYDSAQSILEQRVIAMLLHLGLLRIGEHAAAGRVIRITPLGKAVIQGTYKC